MPIPKNMPPHRRLWAWLTWASAEQAASDSAWALGVRLLFRPDRWRAAIRELRAK